MKKETILAALSAFARQRPGLDFQNYGTCESYNSEMRSITRTLADFRQLYRQVELSGITAEELQQAAKSAYSGRLSLVERDNGDVGVSYCAGQYWPTEYRRAACAVLARALWNYRREKCMPPAVTGPDGLSTYAGLPAGDWIRRSFRREFGRGMQSRWFD